MIKIMSISLGMFLLCNNYMIGSEIRSFKGRYGSQSLVCDDNANIAFIDSGKCNYVSATFHKDTTINFTDASKRNSMIATLHNNAKIGFTDSSTRNSVKCDVLSSVKKIVINADDAASYNNVVINMPFSGEMPEVTCKMRDASKRNDVTIYSFQNVKVNYSDNGKNNSCRVVSPLRKLITPTLVAAMLYGGYKMFSSE